jgi:hypothetical protein
LEHAGFEVCGEAADGVQAIGFGDITLLQRRSGKALADTLAGGLCGFARSNKD